MKLWCDYLISISRLFNRLCVFLLLVVMQHNPMICKCSYDSAYRQVQERHGKWRDVHLTGCKEMWQFFFVCCRQLLHQGRLQWLMVPLSVCVSGRVPAPPWKGEVWSCTTQERVSPKLCTSRCPRKYFLCKSSKQERSSIIAFSW